MKIEYIFMIFGVGGTGGNFVKEFCRFLSRYQNKDKVVKAILIDGDVIEEKNCERQPFFKEDINQKKSSVLAEAIGDAFGYDVFAFTDYITNEMQINDIFNAHKTQKNRSIPVLIGCVDNHRCRQVLHSFYKNQPDVIYFDSANEFSHGEVVFSSKFRGKELSPPRSYYFPDVLTDTSPNKLEESCQVVNVSSPQHLVTNLTAANILLVASVELLTNDVIKKGIVYFNSFNLMIVHRDTVKEDENGSKLSSL